MAECNELGSVTTEVLLPPVQDIEELTRSARDEIAKFVHIFPEKVRVAGYKVYFVVGESEERDDKARSLVVKRQRFREEYFPLADAIDGDEL